jgi:hypothetical protein
MSDPTVSGLLITAVTSLGGVVVFLWKQISDSHKESKLRLKESEARHDECDDDRRKLWQALYAIHPAAKELKEI